MKPRIVQFVEGVNMALSHEGLRLLLLNGVKPKLDITKLEGNELVMCLNRSRDKLKVIGGKGLVIGYIRSPRGRLMLEAIQYLPETFGGGSFSYESALKKALAEKLSKQSEAESPLIAWQKEHS